MRCGPASFVLPIDLLDPAGMTPSGKLRLEPGLQNLHPFVLTHEPSRENEDIGVVVLPCQLRDFRRPGLRPSPPRVSVRRVRDAEPTTAQQNAAIDVVLLPLCRDAVRIVG